MSQIKINMEQVNNIGANLEQSVSIMFDMVRALSALRNSIDSRIQSRGNISGRLQDVRNTANDIEMSLSKLQSFLCSSSIRYRSTDDYLNKLAYGECGINGDLATNESLWESPEGTKKETLSGILEALAFWTDFASYIPDPAKQISEALSSGFEIVEDGGYYIIKGSPGFRRDVAQILGTRYKQGSAAYYRDIAKYVANGDEKFKYFLNQAGSNIKDIFIDSASGKFSLKPLAEDTYVFKKGEFASNFGKALGYASIGLDVAANISEDINEGITKPTKYAADVSVDIVRGLGNMAVATAAAQIGGAIGTAIPIPVVGTVVGAAAGFALGYGASCLYNQVLDAKFINGKSITDYAKEGVEKVLDGAVDIGENIYNGAAEFANDVGKNLADDLESSVKSVGNFFGSAGKAFGGVFA